MNQHKVYAFIGKKIDDCFAYVIELLDEVIESKALPRVIENRTTELGRFTQPAAYMLKAKALLYWAVRCLMAIQIITVLLIIKESHSLIRCMMQAREKAAVACKAAINMCDSAGIRLYQKSDFAATKTLSDETMLVNTLRSSVSERWNIELVWGKMSA